MRPHASVAALVAAFACAAGTSAQTSTRYTLDPAGEWKAGAAPVPGSDEAIIAQARKDLAEDRPTAALSAMNTWLEKNERSKSALLPLAYITRGDARTASGDEFEALYDYEAVVKQFAGQPEFITASERELEIAVRYVNGMDRKSFGLRWISADDIGTELLIRIQERLPGSQLAERAGIELADYYYRESDMELASEAYELFLLNYPQSPYRMKAMQRRIYSSLARFKGPRYDGSPLTDSRVLIRRFSSLYPAQAQQAGLDEALLTRIDESAGAQMMESARYYFDRGDLVAARYTLNRLLAAHPQTAAAGRAVDVMRERGWLAKPADANAPEPAPVPEAAP
ncbi:MAG: outer membrane protein assembly factor BamD [Phycisphaerales bacterium]